jgi:CxxC motif-containing protein (DUF1111 family)
MRSASRVRLAGGILVCAGLAATFAVTVVRGELADQPPPGGPPAVSEEVLQAGRELFTRVWVPGDRRSHGGDGLGPVFNAQSCVACHDLGGPGGAGRPLRNVEIATAVSAGAGGPGYAFFYAFGMDLGAGKFEYKLASNPPASSRKQPAPALDPIALAAIHPGFRESTSVLLHRFGTDPEYHAWRARVPGPHGAIVVKSSERSPMPLFGAGLIDAIPDEAIEVAAKRKAAGAQRVAGRISRTKDGRIGRFGWKAQTATLEEFVLSAAASEIGLEVPGHPQAADPRLPGLGAPGLDMNGQECDALVAYVRSLPAPVVREPADPQEAAANKAGESTFRSIGCAGCHLPKLGDVEGIYSDLLLHDMSPKLGDTGSYGVFTAGQAGAGAPAARGQHPRGQTAGASAEEWRTPPLWGLRDSAPYMHDGRAATIAEAIAQHGGQGAASAQRFAQLSTRRKQQLETFLSSLAAPPLIGEGG